jgi:hypothetical protein
MMDTSSAPFLRHDLKRLSVNMKTAVKRLLLHVVE